ncbi:alternate-type signal peptide domain-containing protein [Leifsonia poae]|uniref:alternate-type signal peptide domain-containing protein n=1 Tax=Leifsonia poae TaxID=110933 RepID=UPI001CBB6EE6|nr:alternate-type signal peptide domain-containing protein [Leifsonia poae]
MNKLTKGIVVASLGAVLVIGTSGTLALWNVSSASEAGRVVMGDMNLKVKADGQAWEVRGVDGKWSALADPTKFRMVPGDAVRLTQPLEVTLVGDKMAAILTIDTSSAITTPNGGVLPGDDFTVATAFEAPPAGEKLPTPVAGTNDWKFSSALATGKATYIQKVTFTFAEGATGRSGALSTVDLTATNFVLNQVRN